METIAESNNKRYSTLRSAVFGLGGLVLGLIAGTIFGAVLMYYAYTGMTPTVRDNLMAGAAMSVARESGDTRPPLLDPNTAMEHSDIDEPSAEPPPNPGD